MIAIGTTPAGCTWNVYPRAGADTAASVEIVTTRLAALWTKHNAHTVRVRKLTTAQIDNLEGVLTVELAERLTWGRTYVEGKREDLIDAAHMASTTERCEIEERIESNIFHECSHAQIESLVKFGADRQMASLATAARKIDRAV